MLKDVLKEDLHIDSPLDMLGFGIKMMNPDFKNDPEILQLVPKIQHRIQKYYEKKMVPVMQDLAREQSELLMIEGIRYMKEIIYLVWIIFSLAQCSGIAIENPVMERTSKIRYLLNVLGLRQSAYWLGNLLFDLGLFSLQAVLMVSLVYPLNLRSY